MNDIIFACAPRAWCMYFIMMRLGLWTKTIKLVVVAGAHCFLHVSILFLYKISVGCWL
jgi:hypothetical protein